MTDRTAPADPLTAEQQRRWDAEMAARIEERTCDICRRCKGCRRSHVHCHRCYCEENR